MLHWLSDLLHWQLPCWFCGLYGSVWYFIGRWSYKLQVIEAMDRLLEENLSSPGSGQRGSQ